MRSLAVSSTKRSDVASPLALAMRLPLSVEQPGFGTCLWDVAVALAGAPAPWEDGEGVAAGGRSAWQPGVALPFHFGQGK